MATIILNNINIESLLKAEKFLREALRDAKSPLEKAGAIQGFELCYELAWKTLKRVLAYRGIEVASPRETFRQAALEKLILDIEQWFDFIRKRNLTVHIYNQAIAEEIFLSLPIFINEFQSLISTLQGLA